MSSFINNSEDNIVITFENEEMYKPVIKILSYNFSNKDFSHYLYTNYIQHLLLKLFNENSDFKSNYINTNTEIKVIESLDELNDTDVLIFHSLHLSIGSLNDRIFNYMTKYTTIMINTENIENSKLFDSIKYYIDDIVNRRGSPFVIWDSNPASFRFFCKTFPYAYTYFMPLLHSKFLQDTFNLYKYEEDEEEDESNNKIVKDIDVLVLGGLSEREKSIISQIKEKYITITVPNNIIDFYKLVYLFQRSKIVLNIHNNENNCFDYFKNSFLISNKIFLISELAEDYDFSSEDNLYGIKTNLITVEYEKMLYSIELYLSLYNEELFNTLTNKAYDWFLKNSNKTEDNMKKCFGDIQTWGKPSYSRI